MLPEPPQWCQGLFLTSAWIGPVRTGLVEEFPGQGWLLGLPFLAPTAGEAE